MVEDMNKDLLAFTKQSVIFQGLTEQNLVAIGQNLVSREFKAGEVIFREGDLGQVLYFVHSGLVRIFLHSLDGQKRRSFCVANRAKCLAN